MKVRITEDAPTSDADATLDHIHSPTASITVRGDLGTSEELELRHLIVRPNVDPPVATGTG
jgi:hypothetical protein